MTATVISFPSSAISQARLALANCPYNQPIELSSDDAELAYLVLLAERFVGNIVDYDLDDFLVRLDKWDARTA